ncbi:MAG: DNA repair protein RecO, partial [Myxococcota bacterium]|nr:DNA repair protein RecO [Myxococcota bacterium]
MRSTDSPSAGTRTEAFVLRRIPYGESDLVVHFATPVAGRVACFARAARSSRRRFPSGFPTLALLEVRIGPPPRPEGLRGIHECSVLRPNLGAASDLRRFAAACLLIEIARDTIPEDHPEPEAFGALDAYLRSLDEAPFDAAGLLAAEMRLLAPLGHAPQIARCVVCDRIAPPRRAAFFDHRRGAAARCQLYFLDYLAGHRMRQPGYA